MFIPIKMILVSLTLNHPRYIVSTFLIAVNNMIADGRPTDNLRGGGNGSHASVACAGRVDSLSVNVFTRRPQDWKKEIIGLTKGSPWESKGDLVGKIDKISNNPADFKDVKLWIIGGPAHIH